METLVTLLQVVGLIVFAIIVFAIAMQFTHRARAARKRDAEPAPRERSEIGHDAAKRAARAARYGAQAPATDDVVEEDSRDPASGA